jgi:hypothetical protein
MRRLLVVVVPVVLALASCSTSSDPTTSDPTATYTGGACTYDGPSEFDVNSEVIFTFIDETESEDDVGFERWLVQEGTTTEMIYDDGINNVGARHIPWLSKTQVSASESQVTARFAQPGLYALTCWDKSGGEHDGWGLQYSTLVTANE